MVHLDPKLCNVCRRLRRLCSAFCSCAAFAFFAGPGVAMAKTQDRDSPKALELILELIELIELIELSSSSARNSDQNLHADDDENRVKTTQL